LDASWLLAKVNNPGGSGGTGSAIGFFAFQWIVLVVGTVVHLLVDRRRHPERAGPRRTVELALLWILVFGGAWAIFGGLSHISGQAPELAESIGYRSSMFQWEVGWGDIAIGVLGVGCIWKRDGWMTAAVVALAVSYGGDAIGHVMQWVEHDNTAPDNVWAIPSDVLQPLLAIVLLIAYRRLPERALVEAA
jgi:hypothetical protein